MNNIKILLGVILLTPICNFAMQEPAMVHIQNAQDATQFAGQVVAFTPVAFIDDHWAYKEQAGQVLDPALRVGYVTPVTVPDWRFYGEKQTKWGHPLNLLLTFDVNYGCHVLLTRLLKENRLLMRNITVGEAAHLLNLLRKRTVHFEGDLDHITYALQQLIPKP